MKRLHRLRPNYRVMWATSAVAATLLAPGPATAADDDHAVQRAYIQAERRAADLRLEAAERECAKRFVVTSCVHAARTQHGRVLEGLRLEETELDAAERRARAAEREKRVNERLREQAEALRDAKPQPPRTAPTPPTPPEPSPRAPRASKAPTAAEAATDAAEAARNRQAYEERQKRAAEHANALEERRRADDAKRAPAPPLPLPAASDLPR